MPDYSYNDGDGLAVINKTVPDGTVEPVSNLDDAIRQIKAYLKDATAGVAKIQADVTSLTASVDTLGINYYFAAYRTTVQSIAAGAGATILVCNQADVNPTSAFNTSTGRYTIPKAGWWIIDAYVKVTKTVSSTPTDIIHNLDLYSGGSSVATIAVRKGTDEGEVDLRLNSMHYFALNTVIDMRYTLTVGSGSMTIETSIDSRNQGIRGVRVAS